MHRIISPCISRRLIRFSKPVSLSIRGNVEILPVPPGLPFRRQMDWQTGSPAVFLRPRSAPRASESQDRRAGQGFRGRVRYGMSRASQSGMTYRQEGSLLAAGRRLSEPPVEHCDRSPRPANGIRLRRDRLRLPVPGRCRGEGRSLRPVIEPEKRPSCRGGSPIWSPDVPAASFLSVRRRFPPPAP